MSEPVTVGGLQAERVRRCPLCGGGPQALYADLGDRLFDAPGRWNLEQCSKCACAWLDPRPLAAEIPKLYESYFTHEVTACAADTRRRMRGGVRDTILAARLGYHAPGPLPTPQRAAGALFAISGPLREIVEGSVLYLPAQPGARLLDVGCGSGEFLARMRDHGWEVEGIEPDDAAAERAHRNFGLNVHRGDLESVRLPPESFDAVTLNHVIEHVIDPAVLLRGAARVLRPHGQLRVVTPNFESRGREVFGAAWVHLDPPRHLLLFTAAALSRLVAANGFGVEICRTSARDARWVYAASTILARDGRLPGAVVHASAALRARALAFQWREHGVAGRGEELILSATRLP